MRTKLITIAALTAALMVSGCLPAFSPLAGKTPGEPAFQQMKKDDFAQETKRLAGITGSATASAKEKAEAHRQLAIIYLLPANPGRDQDKAINELGKFLELSPGGLDKNTAASWSTAIKSSGEYREMESRVGKMAAENRQLSKTNKELDDRIAKLEQDIEKLKNLDLSLEKKRQSFR